MNITNLIRFVTKPTSLYSATRCLAVPRVYSPVGSRQMSTHVSISQSRERETFQDVLPFVIDSLTSSPKFTEIPDVASWVKKILDYNLSGGKKNRGVITVLAYEMTAKPDTITEENMRLARVLGWCVEMAYFLVIDDVMDGSTTRRGVPCWYRLPDVGFGALNDAILINQSLFEVLNLNFKKMPQYMSIVDLFNECILLTSSGQHLDYSMAHSNKHDYSLFTMERYESIIKYKTAYYSFKLPVFLGLTLANVNDKDIRDKASDICLEIGKFFQIQDDYIDCFGDESVTGKAGTDIQEGKCSWLAVTALQRCNPAQKVLFEKFYGSADPDYVKQIKRLYEQLELPQIYKEKERTVYEGIVEKTDALSRQTNLCPKLFYMLLDMIHKRTR